ncbi:CTLH/CRA C-terminal to lish motif domain-containing protein [Scenedesmus sp. NREL 46B-D3]|nr:CTLH/CRA C-terminal to lish motif domain-containing protein [Scenedesmus sp. NREL 46B-D3]
MAEQLLGRDDRDVVDAALLRVPFESLKRAAKERKAHLDDASEAPEQQLQQLEQLVMRLQGIKRKMGEVRLQEADEAMRCKLRLEHLAQLGRPAKGAVIPWSKKRLDRILADHMLRSGYHKSAARLAKETGSEQLCDMHIFEDARRVVEALQRHDCAVALAWCDDNRGRLRKIKSSLEFKLRLREFLELVRQDQRLAAVAYARKHLAPWASQHMHELQRALATLAFPASTRVATYKALFQEGQWGSLLELFQRELYRMHCLLPESQLTVHLQAGLVALKNPPSSSSSSREDPLHHPDFQALAAGLPCAKHVHSKLICAVTRQIMSDANPPMVLPNGYVYSQRAVEQIAAQNGGKVVCPRTGNTFGLEEARRAFIV